jgi:hypothetical protein
LGNLGKEKRELDSDEDGQKEQSGMQTVSKPLSEVH